MGSADPPNGGVSRVPADDNLTKTPVSPERTCGMFTKGNTRYLVASLTVLAGLLASLGGGWFDGS